MWGLIRRRSQGGRSANLQPLRLGLLCVMLAGCGGFGVEFPAADLARFRQTQQHMGTYFTLTLYAVDQPQADRAFRRLSPGSASWMIA